MNKNIRISLAIFIIATLALISGRFEEVVEKEIIKKCWEELNITYIGFTDLLNDL